MIKKLITLCFIALSVVSCSTITNKTQEVTTPTYKLTIPNFLSKTQGLSEEASLQYQNLFKEFYVIVIDETKEEMKKEFENYGVLEMYPTNLEAYADLCYGTMYDNVDDFSEHSTKDTLINNMKAKIYTFTGAVDNVPIFYNVGFYESDQKYYQTFTWTLREKEEEFKKQMDAILYSLTETTGRVDSTLK